LKENLHEIKIIPQGIAKYTSIKEVNCSVLGDIESAVASECEQPIGSGEILSYQDKYESSSGKKTGSSNAKGTMESLSRKLPADIDENTRETIRNMAVDTFKTLGCNGVARIDFMVVNEDTPYFMEVNNGGHFQFFDNSTGIVWEDALNGLKEFGMEELADNFKKVVDLFGGNIPFDRELRWEAMDKMSEDFEELLAKYPEILKCIPILLAVRANEIYAMDEDGGLTYNFKEKNLSIEQYKVFMRKTGLFHLIQFATRSPNPILFHSNDIVVLTQAHKNWSQPHSFCNPHTRSYCHFSPNHIGAFYCPILLENKGKHSC